MRNPFHRMRRSRLRLVVVPLGGAGLLALSTWVLWPSELSDDPTGVVQHSSPRPSAVPLPPPSPPVFTAQPPEPVELTLTQPALAWRTAVIRGQRREVLRGASAFGNPAATEELLLLAQDRHPRVRAFSVRVLGRHKNPDLREAFVRALKDPSPHVRENARWALEQLGD